VEWRSGRTWADLFPERCWLRFLGSGGLDIRMRCSDECPFQGRSQNQSQEMATGMCASHAFGKLRAGSCAKDAQGWGTVRVSGDRKSKKKNQDQRQKRWTGVSDPHELFCCRRGGRDARLTAGTAALLKAATSWGGILGGPGLLRGSRRLVGRSVRRCAR
jgi:hypothetical protein